MRYIEGVSRTRHRRAAATAAVVAHAGGDGALPTGTAPAPPGPGPGGSTLPMERGNDVRLDEISAIAWEQGLRADPAGRLAARRVVERERGRQDAQPRAGWDEPQLRETAYADSLRVLGEPGAEVRRALCGIDLDGAEVMLAKELGCDTVLAHHPRGRPWLEAHRVMRVQADLLIALGVAPSFADEVMRARAHEVRRRIMANNPFRAVDAMRHLGLNYTTLHTVADNCAHTFMHRLATDSPPATLGELRDRILDVPEYAQAAALGFMPEIEAGSSGNRVGRVWLEFTGGTNGPKSLFERLAQAGVGTVITMHIPEDHLEECRRLSINVILAGHMASDSLGMNPILDRLEEGGVELVAAGGLIRVRRDTPDPRFALAPTTATNA